MYAKLAEVRAGNVCVKWSILPHLNVKKDAMKKMKDFIMKVRNNCFHLFHNCQHNFYATLITVTIKYYNKVYRHIMMFKNTNDRNIISHTLNG